MSDHSRANAGATPMALGSDLWGAALAGPVRWNGQMYEGMATLGCEWLDFVNRRMKEDLRLPQRMCACRSPEELRDTYASFWRQAADDYQKEFARMSQLSSGIVSTSLMATQARVEEAARELRRPLATAA